MRKLFLFLLIIFYAYAHSIFAFDITTEIIVESIDTEKLSIDTEIYGTIYANLFKTKHASSDIHLQLGEGRNRINAVYIKFMKSKFDLILGRQLLGWGSGYNFNPTDIFNTLPIGSSFDPVYYKFGRDSGVLTCYFSKIIVDFVYALDYKNKNKLDLNTTVTEQGDESYGIRTKTSIYDFDIAFSYARQGQKEFNSIIEQSDYITGLSIKGSLPYIDWGIWFEGAGFNQQKKNEWVSGIEYIYDRYTMNIEYYYNCFGSNDKYNYDTNLFLRGRLLGKEHIIPSIVCDLNEKFTFTLYSINNLNDSSCITGGVIDYLYNDYIQISLIPAVLTGKTNTEWGIQKQLSGSYAIGALLKANF
ncbi:hypothetical protein ACFL4O_00715 [bacterium]